MSGWFVFTSLLYQDGLVYSSDCLMVQYLLRYHTHMGMQKLSDGTAHKIPSDLKKALTAVPKAQLVWERLTPLARNEWICWNISVKQAATRKDHIQRTVKELQEGKRRPCCWIGCIHRTDKEMSASQKWVLGRKTNAA